MEGSKASALPGIEHIAIVEAVQRQDDPRRERLGGNGAAQWGTS